MYNKYYKPQKYTFNDVLESIKIARKHKIWVSVNYFVFPGVTDSNEEFTALKKFLTEYKINMIQWRNFNIDPEWYIKELNYKYDSKLLGVNNIIQNIKKKFPQIYNGYYNPGKEIIERYLGLVRK